MDYDFSGLCGDQLEKLNKRLDSCKKSNVKEYDIALNVINDSAANSRRTEIRVEVENLIADTNKQISILYANCLNKVQLVLKDHL
jgi:hypothetical protein